MYQICYIFAIIKSASYLRLKCVVGEFLKSSADGSGKLSDLIENALQRHGKLLV